MKTSYPAAIAAVLKYEGGYVNNPRDPGGETNKGVIQRVYDAYRTRAGLSRRSVREITDHEIQEIYKYQYWDLVRGDELPAGVDFCVFDFAVNSGPDRAIKYLQAAVGAKQDGLIGHVTVAAALDGNASRIVNAVCDARLAFLRGLTTWPTFGKGWSARIVSVRALALIMARPSPIPDIPVSVPVAPPAPVPAPPDIEPPQTEEAPVASPLGWWAGLWKSLFG